MRLFVNPDAMKAFCQILLLHCFGKTLGMNIAIGQCLKDRQAPCSIDSMLQP
jgi:hypothetical protein